MNDLASKKTYLLVRLVSSVINLFTLATIGFCRACQPGMSQQHGPFPLRISHWGLMFRENRRPYNIAAECRKTSESAWIPEHYSKKIYTLAKTNNGCLCITVSSNVIPRRKIFLSKCHWMSSDATVVNSDKISRIALCEEKVCGHNTHITYVIVLWHKDSVRNNIAQLIFPLYCICASVNWISIDLDNGLSPVQRQVTA